MKMLSLVQKKTVNNLPPLQASSGKEPPSRQLRFPPPPTLRTGANSQRSASEGQGLSSKNSIAWAVRFLNHSTRSGMIRTEQLLVLVPRRSQKKKAAGGGPDGMP